jgi:putative hydrolases of HD superfamily
MTCMQRIDPADKRQPNVQIAASIRAAILTGELAPGEQLMSGPDLAEFFGVSRMTVQAAIRRLQGEGFVRSRAGSGTFVHDLASLPGPEGEEHELAGAAAFLYEMGHLKAVARSGWLLLGIPLPESVAEHSFRTGIAGIILAAIDGADVGRTAALCLLHDAHETRLGDVPSVGRAYVSTAAPEAVTAHQTAGMPAPAAKAVTDLVAEFEANETREARLAHDADKIEMLAQAIQYQAQGHDTREWQENALAALRTEAGSELARAVTAGSLQWWAPFNASYAELRATTRARERQAKPDA